MGKQSDCLCRYNIRVQGKAQWAAYLSPIFGLPFRYGSFLWLIFLAMRNYTSVLAVLPSAKTVVLRRAVDLLKGKGIEGAGVFSRITRSWVIGRRVADGKETPKWRVPSVFFGSRFFVFVTPRQAAGKPLLGAHRKSLFWKQELTRILPYILAIKEWL